MLALVKDLPATFAAQQRHEWQHRLLEPLRGGHAVIVGAGSIARSAGSLLRAVGMRTTLVARSEREGGPGEGRIRAIADLQALLPTADWLVVIAPLTPATHALIGADELALLPSGARLVNIGRGPTVVEEALVASLRSGHLRGAALDVFELEPLPAESPLWELPGVIVSPHIGGDEADTPRRFSEAFLTNLRRYLACKPLLNVVDKHLGFVPRAE
jgi:phosphoglycerate dehydrogenase-like enzyme